MLLAHDRPSVSLAWVITAAATAAVSFATAAPCQAAPLDFPHPRVWPVQVIAHRGVTSAAPENTRPALQLAVDIAADWVEIDIRRTKDGHHVLMHDSTLDRTTNGSGKVADHTLEQIRELDAGSWFAPRFGNQRVPTLPQVLAWAQGKINLYLDCKDVAAKQLVREILETGTERGLIVFGSRETCAQIHTLSGGQVPIMPNVTKDAPPESWFASPTPAALEVDHDLLTEALVKRARSAKVSIQTDALGPLLDTPDGWRKIIQRGADWIQTDRPDELLGLLYKQGAKKRKPFIVGDHRGAMQLAPENTLAAFKKSIALGMEMTELDLRTTKDGHLVVIHDPTLDRTTNGSGAVVAHTLAELRKLDAGSWFAPRFVGEKIPTFEEVLRLCKGKIRVKVDVKQADPAKMVAVLRKCGMANEAVLVLDDPPYLQKLAEIAPEVPYKTWLRKDKYFDDIMSKIKPESLEIAWGRLTPENIKMCKDRGVQVFTYTPHQPLTLTGYIAKMKMGVDIIQTDFPPLVARAVEVHLASGGR